MSFNISRKQFARLSLIAIGLAGAAGCTQSIPSQFKLLPAEDTAPAAFEVGELDVKKVTVPVDILWVIDNSASMLTSQTKLKNGLAAFARDYLTKDATDIQLAVITTDTFVANSVWTDYLNTKLSTKNATPRELNPKWGPNYAKLTSGALMKTKVSRSGLISNFQSRVSVGTNGIYEEHGFDSVSQFIADNEKGDSANKLFRKGSQRIIIFLSDENDQSFGENAIPDPKKLLYSGSYYSGKIAASADAILPPQFTINCPGDAYVAGAPITANTAMTLCLRDGMAEPVGKFKGRLDSFFRELDGNPGGNPNYFVTAIVGKDASTIEGLRKNTKEKNSETGLTVITNEVGTRYLELVDLTGNGSFAMDIGANDYSPILNKVGLEIEKRSFRTKTTPQTTFDLARAPDPKERLAVTVTFAYGNSVVLEASQFHVTGKKLVISDKALIAVLQPGDRISVVYQPSEQVPADQRRK